jgi:hypothetical protein
MSNQAGVDVTDLEAPEFAVARVFDFADPVAGPGFRPDHPKTDDPARHAALLAYLRGGEPVLITEARMDDVLDPAAGPVVPGSFRTDGQWIWTDAVAYYLERHSLTPDAELTAHIDQQLRRDPPPPPASEDAVNGAASFLLNPPAGQQKAIWYPSGNTTDARENPPL